VRRSAISGLLETGVAAERRQSEIMPMIVDHLTDRSKRIRRYAAGMLEWCAAADVPVDRVARALVDERDTSVRWALESLLRAALEEQNASEVKV
jgi:anti-sigma factor ChrR (cupin superfamily)